MVNAAVRCMPIRHCRYQLMQLICVHRLLLSVSSNSSMLITFSHAVDRRS